MRAKQFGNIKAFLLQLLKMVVSRLKRLANSSWQMLLLSYLLPSWDKQYKRRCHPSLRGFFFIYLKDIYTSIMDLGLDMYLQLRVRLWWNLMVSTLSENQFHFPFSLSSLCIRNWGITVLSITISWKKGFKIERPSVSLEGQARKLRHALAMFLIKKKHGKVF